MADDDVIIIGAGLSGLVTAATLTARGTHVTLLDAEPRASLGGQAFWSFGGVRWFLLVQWAERGGHLAGGHGNTVPRFHVT